MPRLEQKHHLRPHLVSRRSRRSSLFRQSHAGLREVIEERVFLVCGPWGRGIFVYDIGSYYSDLTTVISEITQESEEVPIISHVSRFYILNEVLH